MQADEYVVYSPHQQCLRYLVEFSLPQDLEEAEKEEPEDGDAEGVAEDGGSEDEETPTNNG